MDWIPVGERLPKKPGYYLVTEALDTVTPTRVVMDAYYADDVGWQTNDQRSTVVAWMEKPEVYMGDRSGRVGYSPVTWSIELTPEEVALFDQMADYISENGKMLVVQRPAYESVARKIKAMTEVSKRYPGRQEGDWVVRDKEPL
jgi:hypothetical protein